MLLWNGSECGEKNGKENLKGIIPIRDYGRLETKGECRMFSNINVITTVIT